MSRATSVPPPRFVSFPLVLSPYISSLGLSPFLLATDLVAPNRAKTMPPRDIALECHDVYLFRRVLSYSVVFHCVLFMFARSLIWSSCRTATETSRVARLNKGTRVVLTVLAPCSLFARPGQQLQLMHCPIQDVFLPAQFNEAF